METTVSFPLDDLRGCLGQYYFCRINGKLHIKKRPDRSHQVPTQKQIEARQEFARKYAKKRVF